MKRILASGFVVSVVASLVIGCGGTNNPGGVNLQRRQLLGTWRDANIEAGGLETGCPGTLTLTNNMVFACGGTIEFRSDSTFTQTIDRFNGTQVVRNGRWTLARNLVSLFFDDVPANQAEEQYTIILGEDGNSFQSTEMKDGISVKILLIRQTQ
jgi:hypothetical protein